MKRQFESSVVALVVALAACSEPAESNIETTNGSGGVSAPTGGVSGSNPVAGGGNVTGGTAPGGSGGNGGSGGSGIAGDFGGTDVGGSDMGGIAGLGGMAGAVIGGAPTEGEPLVGLAPEREAALCLEIENYLNTPEVLTLQHEMDCRSAGFYATAGSMPGTEEAARSSCELIYEGCLAGAMPTMIGDCVNASPACTATVGDLLACWHTQPAQLTLALAGIPSCSALTLVDLQTTVRPSPPPSAECQAFNTKCPPSAQLRAP